LAERFAYLKDLNIIKKDLLENNSLDNENRKIFWKIVGKIKRDPSPSEEEVLLASEIRDKLYSMNLGEVKPTSLVLFLFTLCGFGFITASILFSFEEINYVGLVLGMVIIILFMFTWLWIINIGLGRKLLLFAIIVGGTILLNFLALYFESEYLFNLNRYYIFASVPSFYLYGRILGGYLGNIKFDGVTRDVFYFPTMKINYKSYLLAKATSRQWIFFFGGIGTIFTSLISAIILFVFYSNTFGFIFPLFLFVGEIMDYLGMAGVAGGAELHHLRREHKIIKDWKRNLHAKNMIKIT
jgi:hypothetical protein